MSYTIQNLQDVVARELHGASTDDLGDFNDTVYRAGLILLDEIDPPELERVTQISPAIYDDIDIYTCPDGFRSAIDLLPSTGRLIGNEGIDDFRRTSSRQFSQRRNIEAPIISDAWRNGTRFLLLRKYPKNGQVLTIDSLDATTGWTAGWDAGSLVANNLNFLTGNSSLSIALDGLTGQAYIQKTTLSNQDLTNFRLLGAWFYKAFIPSGYLARFTSFQLFHGNDVSTAYWSKTVTTTHDGSAFREGWNILRFDWSSATEVGTVDETLMDSARLIINYTAGATIAGVLFDDFTHQLGTMYDLHFQSNYLYRTSAGVWIEKPSASDGSDIINLSYETLNILIELTALLAMREVGGKDKDFESLSKTVGWPHTIGEPTGLIGSYLKKYPSQKLTSTTITHDFSV